MRIFKYALVSSIIFIMLSNIFCSGDKESAGGSARVHLQKGISLAKAEKYEDAIKEFKLALRKKRDYADAYSAWGLALNGLKRYEEAAGKFEKAVEIESSNPEFYSNWGLVLSNSGKYEQAVEKYREAIKLKPNMAGVHGNLGFALLEVNKKEEAIKEFNTALELFKKMGRMDDVKKVEEILEKLEGPTRGGENVEKRGAGN